MDGKLAWTPGSADKIYTIDGRPDLAEAFRNFDAEKDGAHSLKRDNQEEDTWITIVK